MYADLWRARKKTQKKTRLAAQREGASEQAETWNFPETSSSSCSTSADSITCGVTGPLKPDRFCSVTEDGLAANRDASRQHLLPLIYRNPQREYEFGMETHLWPSGVIIQNGADVLTRRRLHCVDAGGHAPTARRSVNVITASCEGGRRAWPTAAASPQPGVLADKLSRLSQ